MKYHTLHPKDVENTLSTNFERGLKDEDVQKRLQQFGYNELMSSQKQSAVLLLLSQFKDFLVIVLIVAVILSALLGEYIDAITILAIVMMNGILGFFQERKAEKSLEALKKLSTPQVRVLRNGDWKKISSKELVPGDIISFSSGDRIAADVRIIEATSLEVEESPLTGESVPVEKSIEPLLEESLGVGDLKNMAFMGTLVTRGNGIGVVV